MDTVWIVMNTEDNTGPDSILGVFKTKQDAKNFIADYVLDNEISTEWLSLTGKEVSIKEDLSLF